MGLPKFWNSLKFRNWKIVFVICCIPVLLWILHLGNIFVTNKINDSVINYSLIDRNKADSVFYTNHKENDRLMTSAQLLVKEKQPKNKLKTHEIDDKVLYVNNVKVTNVIHKLGNTNEMKLSLQGNTVDVIKTNEKTSKSGNMKSVIIKESRYKNSNCGTTLIVTLQAKDGVFQQVSKREMYVYSAYLDTREFIRIVRIIGISPLDPVKMYCQLFYKDGVVVSARAVPADLHVRGRDDQAPFKYKPHFYECEEKRDKIPHSVSLSDVNCTKTVSNLLKLHNIPAVPEKKVPNKYLICLKVLHDTHSPFDLLQFIEFQKHYGATNLALYDTSNISENVTKVIKYYQKEGFLKILPWRLPVLSSGKKIISGSELRMFGQQCQVNDCIYRHMNLYKHIILIDFDEYIIPINSILSNYSILMDHISKDFNQKFKDYASVSFLNAHFCVPRKKKIQLDIPSLKISTYLKRTSFNPFPMRSKSIVNPRRVKMIGMHTVTEGISPYQVKRSLVVPPSFAYLHHYRKLKLAKLCSTKDTSALIYADILTEKVNHVCDILHLNKLTKLSS